MVRWVVGSILHGGPIELFFVQASTTTSTTMTTTTTTIITTTTITTSTRPTTTTTTTTTTTLELKLLHTFSKVLRPLYGVRQPLVVEVEEVRHGAYDLRRPLTLSPTSHEAESLVTCVIVHWRSSL